MSFALYPVLKGVINLNNFIKIRKGKILVKMEYISFREISPYFIIPNDLVHVLALFVRHREYPLPIRLFNKIILHTGYRAEKPRLYQYMKVIKYYIQMQGSWGERFIGKTIKFKKYIKLIDSFV